MAILSPPFQSSIILLFLLLATTTSSYATGLNNNTPFQEHETMLEALRIHGYTLFTNAIATSDLQYQLLTTTTTSSDDTGLNNTATNASIADAEVPPPPTPPSPPPFTLFAPSDELLFALDMDADADIYVSTLKYHVIPNRRHTFADLQNLISPFLETLLPHYSVLIGKTRDGYVDLFDNATVGLMVDGVRLSDPDIFLGSRIAVHGIDGILLSGLNMNHQFDRNDSGSDLFAPTVSPAPAESGFERNIPADGTLPPISQLERENISAVAPATRFDGKVSPPPPGISQDKAGKSLSGKKKLGRRRRRGGGGHFQRPRRHHRHHLEDL